MYPQTLLRSPRLRLVALTEDDLATIVAWYQDTEFMRLLDALPATPKAFAALRDWLKEANASPNDYLFGVRLPGNNALVGYVELDGILWPHRVCGLCVAIGERQYWGQGCGTEAAGLALDFAFQELNLHRVQATVFRYNLRSIAMCERLGFRREGVYREFLQRDGARHDMLLYGLLRHEHRAGRA